MDTKKIAVITNGESDMLEILRRDPRIGETVIPIAEMEHFDLDVYDAFFILAGAGAREPVALPCPGRNKIEAQIARGKRVFSEFAGSIGLQYLYGDESTRYSRMVYAGCPGGVLDIETGALLDDQCNFYVRKCTKSLHARPLLIAEKHVPAHRLMKLTPELLSAQEKYTLWLEFDNLMICTFRLCNFIRACFSPKKSWRVLVDFILRWTTGLDISASLLPDHYAQKNYDPEAPLEDQARRALTKTLRWFDRAGMLIDNGRGGVYEGFGTEIYPDGTRKKARAVRDDCVGEVSMMYGMDYLLTGNRRSLEVSDNLAAFLFNEMQCKEGIFKGMLRWTDTAWGVCYTHDTGRAVYGELFKNLYLGRSSYLEEIRGALDFLIKTTGSDGRRVRRTDINVMGEEEFLSIPRRPCSDEGGGEMHNMGTDTYSLAAMLALYKLTGIEKYKTAALRGFEACKPFWAKCLYDYPEAYVSGGLCGALMPLSWLYHTTKTDEDKKWLYAFCEELQKYRHPNGGYLEWFKGKNGAPAPVVGDEGSLLVENGNPVVDNLYIVNWLSMGFSQAYLVTGDSYFMDLWRDIARYYIDMQIHSRDPLIDGAWARSSDMELFEVFAIPNDVGWGPWAIETGWTMGPIGAGLAAGLMAEELRRFYR
jgi:hypothetical protein